MEIASMSSLQPVNNVPVEDENLNSDTVSGDDGIRRKLMSDTDREVLMLVFYVILTGTISFFGVFTNIITIIVFLKQGLSDTVNISLLGRAVSDLGCVLALIGMSIFTMPLFRYSDIPFESVQVRSIMGWVNSCFSSITSCITAYITFERCLCIAFPLKVKGIITIHKATIIIISIFLLMIATTLPALFAFRFDFTFVSDRNITLLGLVLTEDGPVLLNIVLTLAVITKLSTMPVVIICTIVLIRNLHSKSLWRKTNSGISASGANETSATLRDKRVVKMVSFIACIFIICLSPSCINAVVIVILSPEYNVRGHFENTYMVNWSIICCFEAIKSSVNVFVYYKMSSRFKAVFAQLFGIDKCGSGNNNTKKK